MPKFSELKVGDRIIVPESEYANRHCIKNQEATILAIYDAGISLTVSYFIFKTEFEEEEVNNEENENES